MNQEMNVQKLTEGLGKLTGYDMEKVETECRKAGNFSVILTLTSDFKSRIAARALGISVHDLRALPIKEYNQILNETANFLSDYTDEVEVENRVEK